MKKYFCISDVHSFYDAMIKALDDAGFDINNEDHIVVNCGDLLDRGDKALDCIHFMNDLYDKGKAILIRGNHEDLLEDCFKKRGFDGYDYSNGTVDTFHQISGIYPDTNSHNDIHITIGLEKAAIEDTYHNKELRKYLDSTVDYFETPNYVCVHGFVPEFKDWRTTASLSDWEDARWTNGFVGADRYWKDNEIKTIIFGHWSTMYAHNEECFDTYIGNKHVGLDATTVLSGKVNCFVFEEEDGN